jgi:hypothetical protein
MIKFKDIIKAIFIMLFFLFYFTLSCQTKGKAIKFIPQMSFKIGSQTPAVGGQFDLVAALLLNNKYSLGIGGGYCTNMGMGGKTFPLYADLRMFFPLKKKILFARKDEINEFYIASQIGLNINSNKPFKTGFLAAFDMAYKFDFIKIKQNKFPAFYAGLGIEYSYSKFKDEYRGFLIQDGVLKHLMLNLKIAFDIPSIKI